MVYCRIDTSEYFNKSILHLEIVIKFESRIQRKRNRLRIFPRNSEMKTTTAEKMTSLKEYYYGRLSIQLEYVCEDVPPPFYIWFSDNYISSLTVCVYFWYKPHMEMHSLLL